MLWSFLVIIRGSPPSPRSSPLWWTGCCPATERWPAAAVHRGDRAPPMGWSGDRAPPKRQSSDDTRTISRADQPAGPGIDGCGGPHERTPTVAIEERSGAELWAMAQLSTPMAVRVAATLRVADHIAAGVRTAAGLAPVVQADPDALGRLLSFLAVRGVFSRDEDGRFSLTGLGEALREDHPAGKRKLLDIDGLGRAELSFIRLLHSVRTGEAAFPQQFGRTFWQDLAADPGRADAFDRW